jgi:hypothetical protein
MFIRLRSWIRRQWTLTWTWCRRAPSTGLPFELDEFARLLSSRDPAAFRQLADGLAGPVVVLKRSGEVQA